MARNLTYRNRRLALISFTVAAGMVGASFAAVPLYEVFCQVTGYGGTTGVAESAPHEKGEKEITVLFNADTDPNLPWEFRTLQRKVKVTTGVDTLIYFEATNTSDEPTTGVAVYNVTPNKVGQYFDKIQCFCFDNQTLQPGEKMEMPVSFFIDPALEQDLDVKEVRTITLSYTFFKAKETK